jgi:hypothetical protein
MATLLLAEGPYALKFLKCGATTVHVYGLERECCEILIKSNKLDFFITSCVNHLSATLERVRESSSVHTDAPPLCVILSSVQVCDF